jgi:aminodeoxychorismate synthase component I
MWRTTKTSSGAVCAQAIFELELELAFWRYQELYQSEPYSVLLDSARDPGRLGRYSFIVGEPERVFEARRRPESAASDAAEASWVQLRGEDGEPLSPALRAALQIHPFEELSKALAARSLPPWLEAPVPFVSGAVGYLAYEAAHFIEDLPSGGVDDLGIPHLCFLFTDIVWAHDHQTGRSYLLLCRRSSSEALARAWIERSRERVLGAIAKFERDPPRAWVGPSVEGPPSAVTIHGHADQAIYMGTVERAKEHIRAGDIFEVCTTHRLEASCSEDPWILYQELRRINPAPFACFLRFPWGHVVSSSPERFLRLGHDRVAECRPIKGTRPRGDSPERDAELRADLFRSIKDRAENVMIVDLVRNDLGRVCEIGSVEVSELMAIEAYATVFQMVSTIRGKLREDKTPLELIQACFPGGSMTGAPKIESMKIIDSVEPFVRGVYSGSIGYLDDSGPLDFSIVIRTFVVKNGRCYFSVGGAVVADSDPAAEYVETQDKAAALIRALRNTAHIGAEP